MKTITKKFPIYAGLAQSRIKKVGYKWIKLTYDSPEMDCLISEKEVKRIIF